MAWSPLCPDGSKSVKDNNPIILGNTVYTKTTLNIDHFWNIGANEDGHHKQAQMPKTVTVVAPIGPADVTLATGMDAALYAKQKTAAESVVQQDVNLYFRNANTPVTLVPHIMQLLGIRACIVFYVNPLTFAVTSQYSHNATIVRNAVGDFTVTFTAALPSDNYLVLSGAMRRTGSAASSLLTGVQGGIVLAGIKETGFCKVHTTDVSQSNTDPYQAWFVFFGG
jgi:hypothetical protein